MPEPSLWSLQQEAETTESSLPLCQPRGGEPEPTSCGKGSTVCVSNLEVWDGVLERSLPTYLATAPQTQHVSSTHQVELPNKKVTTIEEDDKDDDIDLFGVTKRITKRLPS